MPDKEYSQQLLLELVEKVQGKGQVAKQLDAVRRSAQSAEKAIRKYKSALKSIESATKSSAKSMDRIIRQQSKLTKSINSTIAPIKKQIALLKTEQKELRRTAKEERRSLGLGYGRGGRGGGWSLGSIASAVGVGSATYWAGKQISEIVTSQIDAGISAGLDSLSQIRTLAGGKNETAILQLVKQFQDQSEYARFGLGKDAFRGLYQIQQSMKLIGLDRANQLITKATGTMEPQALRQMLTTAAGGDIERALLQGATMENVGAITSALNALELNKVFQQDPSKLPPEMQAAMNVEKAQQDLENAFAKLVTTVSTDLIPAFEKLSALVSKVADWMGGLSTGKVKGAALGVGALVAPTLLMRGIGGKGLIGGAKLAGRGLVGGAKLAGRGLVGGAKLAGRGAAALVSNPIGAAVASALAVDELGFNTGKDATRRAGWKGAGALSWWLESQQANSRQAAEAEKMLAEAEKKRSEAKTELEKVRAEKLGVVAQIGAIPHAFGGGYSGENQAKYDELSKQWSGLTARIQELTKAEEQAKTANANMSKKLAEDAKKAQEETDRLREHLQKLQKEAAKKQQFELAENLADARIRAAQSRLAAYQSSPLGFGGTIRETIRTADLINSKIALLQKRYEEQVGLIGEAEKLGKDSQQDRIDALNIEAEINALLASRNQLLQQQTRGYLDAVQAESFGFGKFSKLLIDQDSNLGIGLARGMVKANPLLGNVGTPSGIQPFRYGTDFNANMTAAQKYADQMGEYFQRSGVPVGRLPIMPQPLQDVRIAEAAQPVRPVQRRDNGADQMREVVDGLLRWIDLEEGKSDNPVQPFQRYGRGEPRVTP